MFFLTLNSKIQGNTKHFLKHTDYNFKCIVVFSQRTTQETKGWNLFRDVPIKKESGSMASTEWVERGVKFLKVIAYITVFSAVLGSASLAKGTLLFMTSQLKKGRQVAHCNRALGELILFFVEHRVFDGKSFVLTKHLHFQRLINSL